LAWAQTHACHSKDYNILVFVFPRVIYFVFSNFFYAALFGRNMVGQARRWSDAIADYSHADKNFLVVYRN
jgi:hypothetical protein